MMWFVVAFVAAIAFAGAEVVDETKSRTCQRLPRPMSLSRFRCEVLGEGYTEMMYTSNEVPDFATIPYRFNHKLSQDKPDGVLRQRYRARALGDTSTGNCTYDDVIPSTPLSSEYATFQQGPNEWFAMGYRNFYFTSDPENHLFEVFCNETSGTSPKRQCCTGTYFVYLYTNNVPPNLFRWEAAAYDLWKEMRLRFSAFYFTFRYNVCPGAFP